MDAEDRPSRQVSAGLPDDAFETDGLLTKRPFRAYALAMLAPVGFGLALIGLFDVVEVVNGGFSQRSARLLERLLAARRRENERRRSPAHEAGAGLPAALALGGSDAHVDDFDRVVTLFDRVGFAIKDFSALRYVRSHLKGAG